MPGTSESSFIRALEDVSVMKGRGSGVVVVYKRTSRPMKGGVCALNVLHIKQFLYLYHHVFLV